MNTSWLKARRKAEIISFAEAAERRNNEERIRLSEYYSREIKARDARIAALERQLHPGTQDALNGMRDALVYLQGYFRDGAQAAENLPFLHPEREGHEQARDVVEDQLAAIAEILDGRARLDVPAFPDNSEEDWLT